jgi:hypothetical protein
MSVEKSPYSELGKAGIMGQKICFKLQRKMSREGLKNWEEGRNEFEQISPISRILGILEMSQISFQYAKDCVDQIVDTNQLSKYNRFTNCSPNLFQTPNFMHTSTIILASIVLESSTTKYGQRKKKPLRT